MNAATTGAPIIIARAVADGIGAASDVQLISQSGPLIQNVVGSLYDPVTLDLHVRDGSGRRRQSRYDVAGEPDTIVRDAEGVYYAAITLDVPGVWSFRWVSDVATHDEVSSGETLWEVSSDGLTGQGGGMQIDDAGNVYIGGAGIGFFNAAPIPQPTLDTGQGADADDVIDVLQDYGLIKKTVV